MQSRLTTGIVATLVPAASLRLILFFIRPAPYVNRFSCHTAAGLTRALDIRSFAYLRGGLGARSSSGGPKANPITGQFTTKFADESGAPPGLVRCPRFAS